MSIVKIMFSKKWRDPLKSSACNGSVNKNAKKKKPPQKNYAKGQKSDDKTCLFIFSCLLNRYIFHNYCIFIFNSQNEDMRISSSDHTITKWEKNN